MSRYSILFAYQNAQHVFTGGVKGWVKEGPQYTRLMDGFDEKHWQQLFAEEEKKAAGESLEKNQTLHGVGEGDVSQ